MAKRVSSQSRKVNETPEDEIKSKQGNNKNNIKKKKKKTKKNRLLQTTS